MKHKDRDKESSQHIQSGLTDFYDLLDRLLPIGDQVLRGTLTEYLDPLKEKASQAQDDIKYELELEKDKVKCLLELLGNAIQRYQRVSADYDNFQKRSVKQVQDSVRYEKERLIKSFLPAVDNFEHMLATSHASESVSAVIEGVRIIYDQMTDILKSHDVEPIESLGEVFDPSQHEAMMQQQDPEKEDGIVLQEFQKGYKLHGRVLRPCKVIVNKVASAEPPAQEEPDTPPDNPDASPEGETTDTE